MEKKNRLSILAKLIYLALVLYVAFWGYFSAIPSFVEGVSNHYVHLDSYKMERYRTSVLHLSFYKDYYHEAAGKKKIENMNYTVVEDNVETIKNNVSIFLNKLQELDNPIDVEFNYDNITSDDYYSLISNEESVLLHYYDMDENILYIISYPE